MGQMYLPPLLEHYLNLPLRKVYANLHSSTIIHTNLTNFVPSRKSHVFLMLYCLGDMHLSIASKLNCLTQFLELAPLGNHLFFGFLHGGLFEGPLKTLIAARHIPVGIPLSLNYFLMLHSQAIGCA